MSWHFSTTSGISRPGRAAPRLAARLAMAAAGNKAISRLLAGQRAGLSARSVGTGSKLQRVAVRELGPLAGNRAVNGLFGPDSGRPTVQRAWQNPTDLHAYYDFKWDALVNGVRWYRWKPMQPNVDHYAFEIEEQSDLNNNVADAQLDFRMAEKWKAWEFAPLFWSDELTNPQVEAGIEEPDSSSSEEDLQETKPASVRGDNPAVTSVRAPDWAPRGAFSWPVKMAITKPQAQLSWVVQKITLQHPNGSTEFWEAFPVEAGKLQALNEDIYQYDAKRDFGSIKIQGLMQHHSFGGATPTGMSLGEVKEVDDLQLASYTKPKFWVEGEGTKHDLTFEWSNKNILEKFETVPHGGEAVFKDYYHKLRTG